MGKEQINIRVDEEIYERIEAVRGEKSRNKYLEDLLADMFRGTPQSALQAPSEAGKIDPLLYDPAYLKIKSIYKKMALEFYRAADEDEKEKKALVFVKPSTDRYNQDTNEKTVREIVGKIKKRIRTDTILDGMKSDDRHWIANTEFDNVELKEFQKYLNYLLTFDTAFYTELNPQHIELKKLKAVNDKLINWKHGYPQVSKDELTWLGANFWQLFGISFHGDRPKKR